MLRCWSCSQIGRGEGFPLGKRGDSGLQTSVFRRKVNRRNFASRYICRQGEKVDVHCSAESSEGRSGKKAQSREPLTNWERLCRSIGFLMCTVDLTFRLPWMLEGIEHLSVLAGTSMAKLLHFEECLIGAVIEQPSTSRSLYNKLKSMLRWCSCSCLQQRDPQSNFPQEPM